jgi:hypothetical protein
VLTLAGSRISATTRHAMAIKASGPYSGLTSAISDQASPAKS